MHKKIKYSWIICICCTTVLICTMGFSTNAFAVYIPHIVAQGYSEEQASALISFRCLFSIVGMLVINQYYKYISLGKGISLACILTAIGFLTYSEAKSFVMYLLAAAICGIAYGIGSMIPVSIMICNWFNERRGLALGICTAGTGICTIIFPPLISKIIIIDGIASSFRMQGFFAIAVSAIAFICLKDDPKEMGVEPYGRQNKDSTKYEGENKNTSNSLIIPNRIIIAVATACFLIGGIGTSAPGHFSALFSSINYPEMKISFAISVYGIALTIAKFIFGQATDCFGVLKSTLVSMLSLSIGCVCCCMADGSNMAWMYAGTILLGLGFAPATVGIPMYALDFSNSSNYPRILRWFQLSYTTGGMIISLMPGIMYRLLGEYKSSYFTFIFIILISTFILVRMYRWLNKRKGRKNEK